MCKGLKKLTAPKCGAHLVEILPVRCPVEGFPLLPCVSNEHVWCGWCGRIYKSDFWASKDGGAVYFRLEVVRGPDLPDMEHRWKNGPGNGRSG